MQHGGVLLFQIRVPLDKILGIVELVEFRQFVLVPIL